jgi:hypothetical protein
VTLAGSGRSGGERKRDRFGLLSSASLLCFYIFEYFRELLSSYVHTTLSYLIASAEKGSSASFPEPVRI